MPLSQLAKYRHYTHHGLALRHLSVMAFHEKAGRSQVDSCLAWLNKVCFSRRVATDAMLPFALSRSDSFARCILGVLVSAGAAI